MKAQEEEVNTKKRELEVLIEEEQKLNSDIKKSQRDIEMLVKSLSDVEKLLEEVITRCFFEPFFKSKLFADNWKVWRVRRARVSSYRGDEEV